MRSVACQRCNKRKVKCSGGQPCQNCIQAEAPDECTYRARDRVVRVKQGYVDEILRENERLRRQSTQAGTSTRETQAPKPSESSKEAQESLQNPLFEERPWFEPLPSYDLPIHVSGAADAAFATRARQSISSAWPNHIPRWSFVTDEQLFTLSSTNCPFPSPFRARFLIKVALDTFGRHVHLVRKSSVLESLEKALGDPESCDRLTTCKLYLLLALGEIYSTRAASADGGFPGLKYFARARRLTYHDIERPRMDDIEIMIMLSLYSSTLNRRHSAYMYATTAIRTSLVLGLHLNVPESQLPDRNEREHRVRIFWTAYMLDRRTTSKLGQPVSISLEDVHVDLPSDSGLSEKNKIDFGDAQFARCKIEMAKLEEQIIVSIYARRKQQEPFAQRVQTVLKDLTKWVESLPANVRIDRLNESPTLPGHILHLHLVFNQSVILTTRPILLHIFSSYKRSWRLSSDEHATKVSEGAQALAETCIQCARHSFRLLSDAWVSGSFPMFDYPHTQYLFSSALILAISSLLDKSGSRGDKDSFSTACEFLEELKQAGSLAAIEFCKHIEALKASISAMSSIESPLVPAQTASAASAASAPYLDTMALPEATMTAGMALTDESLQAILAQPLLELDPFITSAYTDTQGLFDTTTWNDAWGP